MPSRPEPFEEGVTLFPKPFRKRQTGEIRCSESPSGLDIEALEDRNQLPCVLRRVPGGALQ